MADENLCTNRWTVALIALLLAFAGQLTVVVWKASELATRVDKFDDDLVLRTQDRYYKSTAERDLALLAERIRKTQNDLKRVERRFQNYPPPYVLDDLKDLKTRVRSLERREHVPRPVPPSIHPFQDPS